MSGVIQPTAGPTRLYPPLVARTAGLSALLWFAIHVALAFALAFAGQPRLFELDLPASLIVVLTCAAAVRIEQRRNSRHLYYANLGISPAQGVIVASLCAASLELALQVTLRAFGTS